MADSSEKVSFCVDMQCSSRRAEAFLVFDKGSQPTVGQQITDMRPTVGRQSADCWQKIFGKAVNDSQPTVGRLSADSFLGELFFIFSEIAVVWMCSLITIACHAPCTYTTRRYKLVSLHV